MAGRVAAYTLVAIVVVVADDLGGTLGLAILVVVGASTDPEPDILLLGKQGKGNKVGRKVGDTGIPLHRGGLDSLALYLGLSVILAP